MNLPIPILIDEWAFSSFTYKALNTYDGSNDELVHADPELTATDLIAIKRLSPSTYVKEQFKLALLLYVKLPLKIKAGILLFSSVYKYQIIFQHAFNH